LNGTHHLLVFSDDVNLLTDNINTIKKNTETLIDGSKEVGPEVNTEKTKYMSLFRHKIAGQNHDIANKCFENLAQFRYLGTTVANENLIQGEIKRIFNLGNSCNHSVQKLLSSRLLTKNIKIRVHKIKILPVVQYGCETWYLIILTYLRS
jgi:hypothetical protein